MWGGQSQVHDAYTRAWLDAMAGRGWTAPTWPVEHGGGGLSAAEAAVLQEELRAIKARPPLVRVNPGLTIIGPVLLSNGTDEQRRRFLPPIVRGETRWAQGFSEPDAGSDLAGVRTTAVLDGSTYVVNGQKIWSSYAHVSDWLFCLVRTDPDAPKHEGLSLLLLDLASPGIDVRPITLISGRSDFCEVFFTDVAVPADQRVGEPGQGWGLAKRLLEHERSTLGSAGSALSGGAKRAGPVELAVEHVGLVDGVLAHAGLRDRLAAHLVEVRALQATTRRYGAEQRHDAWVPSMVKVVSTETHMHRQDLIQDVLGLEGMGADTDPLGDDGPARDWLRSRANSIEGGTTEIQLNIIAKQALGLPTSR